MEKNDMNQNNVKSSDIDYTEFKKRFSNEIDCLNYLVKLRWPNGFSCPRCGCEKMWEISPYKYKCRQCNYQTTATSGTIFHQTHLSLYTWFRAIWYMSVGGNKISASSLKKELDIGSNRTALTLTKKIKSFMFTTDTEITNRLLKGRIDVLIKKTQRKDISIISAVEVENRQLRHIRVCSLNDYTLESYCEFLEANVKKSPSGSEQESIIQKNEESYEICGKIQGYPHIIKNSGAYHSPYATRVYNIFLSYYSQKLKTNPNYNLKKAMEEFTYLVNCFIAPVDFDNIILNILYQSPRDNPLGNPYKKCEKHLMSF